MKPSLNRNGLTTGRPAATGTPHEIGVSMKLVLERVCVIRQICRRMFGIPDYERYLAHAAVRHPDAPVLSRRDFCAQAIERKYGKCGPRCC
jgi:uncharacterized short protein YbdD (DUF466 family)